MSRLLSLVTAAAARPHVLLAVFDDLRPNASSLALRLPHLERVAAGGATYLVALAGYPVCAPARTMLLSGRRAYAPPGSDADARLADLLAAADATLPQWFRRHGYATMGGGKVFDGPLGAAAAARGAWSAGAPFLAFAERGSKCREARSARGARSGGVVASTPRRRRVDAAEPSRRLGVCGQLRRPL